MNVQRAKFKENSAALSGDFGLKVAIEKFGAELVNSFPTFSRGPRKGKLKGYLCWTKCEEGGWSRNKNGSNVGGVVRPGTSDWRLTMADPAIDPKGHAIVARWNWNGGAPAVSVLQTPIEAEAEAIFKAYGSDARY